MDDLGFFLYSEDVVSALAHFSGQNQTQVALT